MKSMKFKREFVLRGYRTSMKTGEQKSRSDIIGELTVYIRQMSLKNPFIKYQEMSAGKIERLLYHLGLTGP